MPKLLMSHFDNLRWSKFTKNTKSSSILCALTGDFKFSVNPKW